MNKPCPLVTVPGQIIGFVNGRPVRTIAGGSEPVVTPPADPAAPPAAPADPAAPPAVVEPLHADPVIAAALANLTPEQRETLLTTGGQKALAAQREATREAKAAADAQAERVKAILKAAGIETEEADPVKALETSRSTNESLTQENRNLRVEIALSNAARTHGADEALLIPVLAHKGELAKLDPAAADFPSKLDALVKQAVTDNPKLKAGVTPPVSGASTPGGPGPAADIDAQIAAATKEGNHRLAISLKRQKAYPPRG